MNVRSEGTMNISETPDYDDFDALLDASSLGAPRVVAALGSATPDARRRFNTAAHHPASCSPAPADSPADTGVQTQRPTSSNPEGRAVVTEVGLITCSTGSGKTHAFLDQTSQARRRTNIEEGFTSRPARLAVTAWPRPFASLPLYVLDEAHRSTNPITVQVQGYLAALLSNRVTSRSHAPRHSGDLCQLFHQTSALPAALRRIERPAGAERDALHDKLVRRLLTDFETVDRAYRRATAVMRLATWMADMRHGTSEQNLWGQAWPEATAFSWLVDADETPADLDNQSFPGMPWSRTDGPQLRTKQMRCLRRNCRRHPAMPPDAPFSPQDLLRRIARLGPAPGERPLDRNGLAATGSEGWLNWLHATAPTDNGWLPLMYACVFNEMGHASHVSAPWPDAPREVELATVRGLRLACRALRTTDHPAPNDQHASAAASTADKKQQHDTGEARIESWHGMVHASITAHLHPGVGSSPLPLPTHLNYRLTDPYAVEAVFDPGPHQVTWTFARDLLADGLHGKAGRGDISIWTSPADSGHPRAFMQLKSPTGTALLSLPPAPVREFLTETTRMVARGSEHALLSSSLNDLEAQLNQLSVFPGGVD
ncbi:SsgA family sporulation/cell division regulator [Streptomyces sp. ISL-99]|uniref:SsgA family sporulation/cell division regulator n=1 Tax=Streptomyces sp. ISL-99 TaxID=2819193 RepID=UPI001BE708DE|nr:SsgA family sporulation/cell division regulator [Streptomyces sp. ISL-99]MBT2529943.1 SsgA family sporulation/cell division regulator [Streptomyces sp. ISL-99]